MNIRQSSNLDGMRGEISVIKGVHADIVESFNDYRLLKEMYGQSRRKCRMNVYKLAAYQNTLMHVVKESISVLNVSRMEIKENELMTF